MEEVLLLLGHRTCGRAAEFLMKRLAMAVSDDKILRRIKRGARATMLMPWLVQLSSKRVCPTAFDEIAQHCFAVNTACVLLRVVSLGFAPHRE